ncbi:hypothetical protein [Tardiphaga sp. 768_D3_N2_1]|uniref:hypothetical protein n=1 Tax=Tardiphaga sp. 768_D3_N2_1 TaxID=3240783 RepID=UPI003F895DFB
MKTILLVAAALLFAAPAMAQHAHQKGPNGGPMEDVAGVHLEMIVSGKTLTFHVIDEASKPIPATGFTGAVLLTSGSDRETLPLVVSGTALKAETRGDVPKGATVSVTLKTAEGKSGQVKFKN